jgi:alpha-D-xyloside xylohydrolase
MEGVFAQMGSWYNFWSGQPVGGGQTVKTDAPLDKIPLFVKTGSILPVGPEAQYAAEIKSNPLEIRINPGAEGEFTLYEDENDNYNYENGAYSTIVFSWDDAKRSLTIQDHQCSFPGMLAERTFNVVLVTRDKGKGMDVNEKFDTSVKYAGKKIRVTL